MYIYIDFLGLKKLFESVPGNSTTMNTPKRHFLKAFCGAWFFIWVKDTDCSVG